MDPTALAQVQPECTAVIGPDESLQDAIDQAEPGAVLCLEAGTWEENISIGKDLTIRGVRPNQTILRPKAPFEPVILINSDEVIEVAIEELMVTGADIGIELRGRAEAMLTNLQISGNFVSAFGKLSAGVMAGGSVQLTISRSWIFGNGYIGLVIKEGAQLNLIKSMVDLQGLGLEVRDEAQVHIVDSEISDNGDGLLLVGSSQVEITDSQISRNGFRGISARGSARLEVRNSEVSRNGVGPSPYPSDCPIKDRICSGIELGEEVQLRLIDSVIRYNADWGLAAVLRRCGFGLDSFRGQVIFEGENIIEGNNRTGDQDDMGNPGEHPWNRPEVSGGQVCLP